MITLAQLQAIMPGGKTLGLYLAPLNAAMDRFKINTPKRQAAFIAQLAHESGSFRYVRELADGKAYEGRRDLGNTEPGDGPRFKGRGLIQITGRFNYGKCSEALYGDDRLIQNPEYLELPEAACYSAAWFWQSHGCNELADLDGFLSITRKINGGTNGIADRQRFWEAAKKAIPADEIPVLTDVVIPAPSRGSQMPIAALIATFGPMLANMIPAIAKLFSSGSEVSERNVAAASVVFDTAIKAAGAVNVQEAVERMQNDPATLDAVRQAVLTQPVIMGLLEVGQSVERARTAAADPAQIPYWKNPAFVMTALCLPLVYMVVTAVVFEPWGVREWSDEMRSVVVTAIVTGLLGAITGFFLGSSYGSMKKTEAAIDASPMTPK